MCVNSETGRLKQVIVHPAIDALRIVEPANYHQLLIDAFMDPRAVEREHARFRACLEKVTGPKGCLDFSQLLVETVTESIDGRKLLNHVLPGHDLSGLAPEALVYAAFTGYVDGIKVANPIPNTLFMRDLATVVGNTVFLANFALEPRWRESLLMEAVLRFHPRYHTENLVKVPYPNFTLEGGDVLVLRSDLIAVGCGERTSLASIMALAPKFYKAGVRKVLAVVMPRERSAMHLDTIFTVLDDKEGHYMVYKPLVDPEPGHTAQAARVVEISLLDAVGNTRCKLFDTLPKALEHAKMPIDRLIPCGGGVEPGQSREQWTDGANLFCLDRGVVIIYGQNERSIAELVRNGYKTVSADLFAKKEFKPKGKHLAVVLDAYELSHGRGGARCMTQPRVRG